MIQQPALVIGIKSDGLFTFAEQRELAAGIPNARLRTIDSPEGHDAFLLQFEQVNGHILRFLKDILPDIMLNRVDDAEAGPETPSSSKTGGNEIEAAKVEKTAATAVAKSSIFGEAEGTVVDDITAW